MRPLYHVARYQAVATRAAYEHAMRALPRPRPRQRLPREVVTFSSHGDLPEQIASLRSLLRWLGRPDRITVVGDGSHTTADRALLTALDPGLEVNAWDDFASAEALAATATYARVSPMGKKLAVMMSLPDAPVLYADSDVLFFPAAAGRSEFSDGGAHYLPDLPGGLHGEVVEDDDRPPANAGFFLSSGALPLGDLTRALMPATPGPDHLYVEQSLVHLGLHAVGASRLPVPAFRLDVDDHFGYADDVCRSGTAVRHYIGMIRYRFWLAVSRASTGPYRSARV